MASHAKVLGDRNVDGATSSAPAKKAVEDIYQKKTQLEHILLRPDTYVGSVERTTQEMTVYDKDVGFTKRDISFVPGLYKIFDEIIVNAADNKQRDPSMDTLKVTIDPEANVISVYNTGSGIPVVMHEKEKVYVPELIFGHLLTSSNYDDSEKKVVGGRNGYGAKLCNIFSTEFMVETCDSERKLKYKQIFRSNMSVVEKPRITPMGEKDRDFTRISFCPDLAKFGMTRLDEDIVALLTRRVYDVAGTTRGVKVFLNDERIPIKSFRDYVTFATRGFGPDYKLIHEEAGERWEVLMGISENGFQQLSFVNSIATTKGGTHVSYVADQIVKEVGAIVQKKNKNAEVKPHQIKSHMYLFVNCLITNPTFDSQTKENMTLEKKKFGSTCELSAKFLKEIVQKTGIIDAILNWAKFKADSQLAKSSSGGKRARISGIPKLDDANEAGGRNSDKCTLILTEGDSAKALAIGGLGVVGRDFYGVFPLRGKLLNVREAPAKQITENAEIMNIIQIMGLKFGTVYETVKQLRYGRLMIMTDQDQDGSHIKGLLINFIHHFWPSLLQLPGFLIEFVTPIVKCSKGTKEVSFFTLPEYEAWVESNNGAKGWKVKYYKGLGTSTPKEAKEYFSNMAKHEIPFSYSGPDDDENIKMAFAKNQVDARKEWLRGFVPGTFLDHNCESISYSEFIHKELILFSMADNVRSIPSVMDGLKPGQRKVLFSCFKRNLKDEIKVAQLAGYVAEHSCYHHGEVSLASTIVGMAQDFVGSNNVNLLLPVGQFGTRLQGGKDAASPRYIFTSLSPLTRALFPQSDEALLSFLNEDGQIIEPEWYCPILPMVLVNGANGIGTGWSTDIPTYNPRDIVANLKHLIHGEAMESMIPYFKGFNGAVTQIKKDKFGIAGTIEKIDEATLAITELPIQTWTQSYKEFLETLMVPNEKDKSPPSIKDYKEHHTDTSVHFIVNMTPEQMAAAEAVGLMKKFKLESTISTTNMMLFDPEGRMKKYESVEEIVEDFFAVRLRLYQKRKAWLADQLTEDYERLDNKVRFILAVINGTLKISNRKRAELLADLKEKGFKPFPKKSSPSKKDAEKDAEEGEPTEEAGTIGSADYDYLLSMPMWSLTSERVQKLTTERDGKETELNTLLKKTPQDLWIEDLDNFVAVLEMQEERDRVDLEESAAKMKKGGNKKAGARKPKKAAAGDSDGEFEGDDDWKPSAAKSSAPTTASAAATKPKFSAPTGTVAIAAAPKAKVALPAVPKVAAKVAETGEKRIHSDSPTGSPTAAPPKTKVAKKASSAPVKKPAFEEKEEVDEESDPEFVSLSERISGKGKAAPARKAATVAKAKTAAIDLSESEDDFVPSEDEFSDGEFKPAAVVAKKKKAPVVAAPAAAVPVEKKAPAAAKAKPKAKPKPMEVSEDEDEFGLEEKENFSEDDYKPVAKPKKAPAKKAAPAAEVKVATTAVAATKPSKIVKEVVPVAAAASAAPKAAPAAKPKKLKAKIVSDEEEEEEADASSPAAPREARSRRAASKNIKYSFESEEEGDGEYKPKGEDSDFEI